MSRFIILAIVFGAIYLGFRRIRSEWQANFKDMDKKTHERDLKEREQPGVIDLKKDDDGVFRPGDKK